MPSSTDGGATSSLSRSCCEPMPNRPFALLLCLTLASCHSASQHAPASAPAAAAAAPRRTHENLNAVVWTQTSAEYRAVARQAYRIARVQLDAALADPSWTAATEQAAAAALPPAVILDLDETVLDNSAFQARMFGDWTPFRAIPYSEDAWNRWCDERKAGAVPGAIDFLTYAASRGVTPIYVSNRDHAVEPATRDVLTRLGAPVDDARDTVLTRHENGWDASDKTA